METNYLQQEILLVTGTSFTAREFSETATGSAYNNFTDKEKLISACWNGLLPEILPEIFEQPLANNKKLYLREIIEASSFIELQLGETDAVLEYEFSIDPYSFLSMQVLS